MRAARSGKGTRGRMGPMGLSRHQWAKVRMAERRGNAEGKE